MGETSDKKRKRSDEEVVEENGVAPPPKKIQVADNETPADDSGAPVKNKKEKVSKAGAIRQLKSERRSKKIQVARQNAAQKAEMIATSNGPDTLANGEDFVSLSENPVVKANGPLKPQSAVLPPQRVMGKPKKASPRSMRKAAKSEKIATRLVEEGLVAEEGTEPSKTLARFICFVGNLPYTATTQQIEAHFVKLGPKAVRHSTDKETGKSKGFAFLEFDDYDRMKTCLKNYHQSIFDPNSEGDVILAGKGKKRTQGRKLNVELTAGGGGNTANRKEKIREKNNHLKEERSKRKVEKKQEMQDKLKKRREQKEKSQAKGSGANTEAMPDTRGIHPSRLSRVPQED